MPDDISPEDLLGYLQKQIQERETKWNEVGRSIRILREAEQVLRQNSPPSSNASAEASPPAEKEGSVSSSETGTPIPIEAEPFVLLEEESEGSFAGEPQDGPEEKSEISMEEIPRNYGENLLEPGRAEESQEILHQTDIPEEPKKSARMPMEDLLPEEQSKLLDGEEVHSNRLIPPKFSSPIEITEIEENPPLADIGPIRAENDKGRKIPSDSSLKVEQAPVLLLSKRESTPPGNISPATKKKPPASATSRLLEYIRGGGALRCLDPWDQLCAVFVLSPAGLPVFACHPFVGYLRKTFRKLLQLHRESFQGAEACSAELIARKDFLFSFIGALISGRLDQVERIPKLKLAGRRQSPPRFEYEFEEGTKTVMHRGVLQFIHKLLDVPMNSFFQPKGPFFEITEYLNQYQELMNAQPEEQRAATLLEQIGQQPEGERFAPAMSGEVETTNGEAEYAGAESEENPDTDLEASFMEEEETLQDLDEFDYGPEDREAIISEDEPILSEPSLPQSK